MTRPSLRSRMSAWGERVLRRVWPWCPWLAPFPGVVAHCRASGLHGLWSGHRRAFHRMSVVEGRPASDCFGALGIAATAAAAGGLCTFRMGRTLAIYQLDNVPRVDDPDLAPSLDANRELFGDFMGALPVGHPDRGPRRLAIETTLGSSGFVAALEPEVRRHARDFLADHTGRVIPLDEFTLELVAHVDSLVPGVLDLRARPLTSYLASSAYGPLVRDLFAVASDVISQANPGALARGGAIAPFVRAVLRDNLDAISAAPETNLIRRHVALWGGELSPAGIAALTDAQLKELATVIVATFDTTCLSLLWAIGYLATAAPGVAERLEAVTPGDAAGPGGGHLSLAEQVVLEAVRLGGSNPTALYRRVVSPFVLRHHGQEVTVPAGTMMWLDRRRANRDPATFPCPARFDLANVRALVRSPRESCPSLLSRARYEINSFSMLNSHRNPRKCPGRLFSVRVQAILLEELYRGYQVAVSGVDLELKRFSSMPRPRHAGTIRISPRELS